MRVYFIEVPYVSSGLRRTYKKKLEVFSGEEVEGRVVADKIHQFKRGKWVEKAYKGYMVSDTREINNYVVNNRRSGQLVFSSLGLAIASKLLLIQDMRNEYERELESLRKLLNKNVPAVDKAIDNIKDDFPEHFL